MLRKLTKARKERSRLTKEEWREYTKTVWQIANVTDPKHPAVFPIEIPRRLIKLFTFIDEPVLDPFAGIGTTARAALELGRKAICIDQNREYINLIHERCGLLGHADNALTMKVGDSRDMSQIADNSVGVIVTSPPYWDKADYGGNGFNIGNEPVYSRFFERIRPVFSECFRVLYPGRKLCIVTANVNQHTDHGLLTFPLAADFIAQLRDIGFVMINEIIWSKDGTGGRWGSANKQRPIFGSYPYPPNFLFKNIHEHILIFAKPPTKRVTGKTVKSYDFLIGRRKDYAKTASKIRRESNE
jgi:site-specific DNA-methyltransferase (adenine-specific)